jgi:hypothetical protein
LLLRHLGYFYPKPRCFVVQSLSPCCLVKDVTSKKSVKTVAPPISKLGFIKVPRISDSNYRHWLDTLVQPKPDQRLFLKLEKDFIDQCFCEQAMQQYALDNNKLKQALADVGQLHFAPRKHSLTRYQMGQNHSNDFWSRSKSLLGTYHPRASEGVSLDRAAKLTLPEVGVLTLGIGNALFGHNSQK